MQFSFLSVSNLIEIIGIIASLITSIVAIAISIKTLKQNSKMIEESTRPYVVVYREYIQVLNNVHEYIVIKNFGSTGAIIDSVIADPPFTESDICKNPFFSHIEGTFIAPNQSINTAIYGDAFKNPRSGITIISIKYHSELNSYRQSFLLNEDLKEDIRFIKSVPSKKRTLEEMISHATEEILRRNL